MKRRTKLQILGCTCVVVSLTVVLMGKGVFHAPAVYEWYQIPTGKTNYEPDYGLSSAAHKTGPALAGILFSFGLLTLWVAKDVKW